jgi:hypothetical protein
MRTAAAVWRHRLRRLAGQSPAELLLLLHAQWLVCRAELRLRCAPRGRMVSGAEVDATVADDLALPRPDAAALAEAHRLEQAVLRVADHGLVRPFCLARAMALQALLDAHALHGSRVVVGVQITDGSFGAHAWVEYGGAVLGDRPSRVDRYVALQGARVRPMT